MASFKSQLHFIQIHHHWIPQQYIILIIISCHFYHMDFFIVFYIVCTAITLLVIYYFLCRLTAERISSYGTMEILTKQHKPHNAGCFLDLI